MFCFRYRRLLVPYSEGALDSALAARLERHLAKCARCRSELSIIRSVAGALCDVDVPAREPADDLWARVSARIADEAPVRRSRVSSFAGLAAGVGAAALVAMVGIRLLSPPVAPTRTAKLTAPAKVFYAEPKAEAPEVVKKQPKPAIPPIRHRKPVRRALDRTAVATNSQPVRPSDHWFRDESRLGLAGGVAKKPSPPIVVANVDTGAVGATIVGSARYFSENSDVPARKAVAAAAAPAPGAMAGTVVANDAVGCNAFYMADRSSGDYSDSDADATASASVVDDLNETEGVRTAAIFSYP